MNNFLFIILFLLTDLALSQENLIYNGSFEEYSSCPVYNNTYNGEFEKAKGWWSPSYGSTPDYMNACNNINVSVPNNFWGYQEAYHGSGYILTVLHEWNKFNGAFIAAEYVQTKLNKQLKPCNEYCISMYISLANGSTTNTGYIEFGLAKDSTFYCDSPECVNQPELLEVWRIPIDLEKDTTNWFHCQMTFQPSFQSDILTIGDFSYSLEDTTFVQNVLGFPESYFAGVYIDSISLTQISPTIDCESTLNNFEVNVFTPNGDGLNDIVDFTMFDHVKLLNRWGNVVLIMDTQSNFKWHGKNFRNEDVSAGVYYYLATKGNKKTTGSIQLIR